MLDFLLPLFAAPTDTATAAPAESAETATGDGESPASSDDGDSGASSDLPPSRDAADQEWDINKLQEDSALRASMDAVGADLRDAERGADAESGAETTDEDPAKGDSTSPTETEDADAEEVDADEVEADEADTDEADTDEADTDEADADETGDEESGDAAPLPDPLRETAQELYPERVVEDTEQLQEAMAHDREIVKHFDVLDSVVEQDEHLAKYLELRVKEGADPRAAAVQAMQELVEAPDPHEDPEAYADWKHEKKLQEQRREQQENKEQELTEQEERFSRQSQQSFEAFAEKHDMGEEELQTFTQRVNTLVFGDQQGRVPSNQAEILWRGLHHEQLVEQARQEAFENGKQEGRNEAIDEEQSRRQGDGLPKFGGSSKSTSELSDAEKELRNLGQSFEEAGADPNDFSW